MASDTSFDAELRALRADLVRLGKFSYLAELTSTLENASICERQQRVRDQRELGSTNHCVAELRANDAVASTGTLSSNNWPRAKRRPLRGPAPFRLP